MFVLAESNQLYVGDMLFYLISFIILAALAFCLEASHPDDGKAGEAGC